MGWCGTFQVDCNGGKDISMNIKNPYKSFNENKKEQGDESNK